MAIRKLRDESSAEGKNIWKAVDVAASRAPEWLKERAKPSTSETPSQPRNSSSKDQGSKQE